MRPSSLLDSLLSACSVVECIISFTVQTKTVNLSLTTIDVYFVKKVRMRKFHVFRINMHWYERYGRRNDFKMATNLGSRRAHIVNDECVLNEDSKYHTEEKVIGPVFHIYSN